MKLYPARKPYKKGYLPVGDGHELFYALYGNPNGIPVLFVHGGPGGGCSVNSHRYFDSRKFNIITVDQRGAGKSRPFAGLRANTTQKLVQDFRKLLRFLKIKKTFLFGGSWGSCLSLCYSIKYPQSVLGMVLRGIYLGSNIDNEYMVTGGIRSHFPEVWERFISFVPKKYRKKPGRYYWKMMNSKNSKTMHKYCYEWALLESSIVKLDYDPRLVHRDMRGKWVIAISKLEAEYFMNDCFLPKNYILKNVHKIKNIPLSIVHGRYDFCCPPESAYILHKALPKSKLFFVLSGHAAGEPEMRSRMMMEIADMGRKYGHKS